jgi:hypothetical protein
LGVAVIVGVVGARPGHGRDDGLEVAARHGEAAAAGIGRVGGASGAVVRAIVEQVVEQAVAVAVEVEVKVESEWPGDEDVAAALDGLPRVAAVVERDGVARPQLDGAGIGIVKRQACLRIGTETQGDVAVGFASVEVLRVGEVLGVAVVGDGDLPADLAGARIVAQRAEFDGDVATVGEQSGAGGGVGVGAHGPQG